MKTTDTETVYRVACEAYAAMGVDVEAALKMLEGVAVSLHCWQGDDVAGFEHLGSGLSGGGIQATGNYPGRARNGDELRADLDLALSLIPGRHRLNLHAIYAETGGRRIARNELRTEHFAGWIDWARAKGVGMDFNGSFFAHPMAESGATLSSADAAVRRFWVEHGIACRRIGADMGRALGSPSVVNLWIPDGSKDLPADRRAPRERLKASLDAVFAEALDPALELDAVESKLFGIGSESYVVGSHEFYMGYAMQNRKLLCLDSGHFHPTETIADKISSVLMYVPEILLHVSRGVRWDSDHVVILSDDLRAIGEELVRGGYLERTHIGLDFFDATINRVAAWVIGTRNMLKSLLLAMLEPSATLRTLEGRGDLTGRLAIMEELKTMPFSAIWNMYCERQGVPAGADWLEAVRRYEKDVQSARK
jgi:L-rhamnose isomerase